MTKKIKKFKSKFYAIRLMGSWPGYYLDKDGLYPVQNINYIITFSNKRRAQRYLRKYSEIYRRLWAVCKIEIQEV